MVSDISPPLHMEDGNPQLFQKLRRDLQVVAIPASSQGDDMRMFEDEQHIRQFSFCPSGPEQVLKVPGLLIVYQAQIYNISKVIHNGIYASEIPNSKHQN